MRRLDGYTIEFSMTPVALGHKVKMPRAWTRHPHAFTAPSGLTHISDENRKYLHEALDEFLDDTNYFWLHGLFREIEAIGEPEEEDEE